MKQLLASLTVVAVLVTVVSAEEKKTKKSPLDHTIKTINGKDADLSKLKGKVVVIVNVASQCGLTPQYEGLQALYKKYNKKGLVIVGVPANEFGRQEPGTNAEISKFCKDKYDVTFPMMAKQIVKGKGQSELYQFLTSKKTNPKHAGEIRWNFTKFLIDRKGNVVQRFEPRVSPDKMEKAIQEQLSKKN